MRINRKLFMTQFLLLLSLLLISISSFVFAPMGLTQTLSGFFSSEKDKEILLNLKQEFDENFEKNENSLRKSYENKKAIIRNNTALSTEQRKNQIFQAHKEYQKGSAQNDARYRDPLVSYIIYSANKKYKDPKGRKNKNDKNRIKDSLGTSLFIRDENGAPSKLNPESRGYRGDRDVQGDMKRLNILAATARELGFKTFISGDTVDIPGLEVTGNRNNPSYGDPGTDKHRLGIRSAAKNPETYLSPGMSNSQPGKNAVAIEDHLGKAKKGRLVSNPNDLLSDGLQDKTQTYAKGTLKALNASGMNDLQLKKILDANGLQMSPQNYREALSRLKQDAPTDAAGINKANVKQFKRATDALQDQIAKNASQQFNEEINKRRQEVNNLAKKTSKNNPEVIKGLNEIEDSKVRFEETKANRLDKNPPALKRDQNNANKEVIQPLKPGETLESKKTLRAKARAGASKIYISGMQGMGKIGDLMTVVSVGNEAVANLRNGKVGAAIDVVTDAALEEAEAYVEYKTLAAINPVFAQGKMAFDIGYMAGTALGKIDIGNGVTIDKKAENFFVEILDKYNGTKKKERANKIRNSLIKELKNGATLGNGMKVVEAAQKIQENIDAGKPPLEGILINPKPAQELIVSEMSSDEKKLLMNDQEFAHLNLKPVNENNKSSDNETDLSKSIKTLIDTSEDDRQPKTPSEQNIEDKLFKNVMASLAARSKDRDTNGFDTNQIKFMNGHLDVGVKALKKERATTLKDSSEKKTVAKEIEKKKNSSRSDEGVLDEMWSGFGEALNDIARGVVEHRKLTQERAELLRKQASKTEKIKSAKGPEGVIRGQCTTLDEYNGLREHYGDGRYITYCLVMKEGTYFYNRNRSLVNQSCTIDVKYNSFVCPPEFIEKYVPIYSTSKAWCSQINKMEKRLEKKWCKNKRRITVLTGAFSLGMRFAAGHLSPEDKEDYKFWSGRCDCNKVYKIPKN